MIAIYSTDRTENFMGITSDRVNEITLWDRIQRGDITAIEEVYRENAPFLYRYGLKFTQNTQLIEDCIQELFSRIISNYSRLSRTDNVKIYLMRAFRNNLVRLIKKEQKYDLQQTEDFQFEILFSAEQKIIDSEDLHYIQQTLVKGLKRLTPRQKEAIYLRYTNGLEYAEISEIMKISVESIRNIIYKAIQLLRDDVKSNDAVIIMFLLKAL